MAYTDGAITTDSFPAALSGGGVPDDEESQPRYPAKSPAAKLERWSESVNLTFEFDDDELTKIGADVIRDYEIDEASRSEWKAMHEDAFKLALQVTSNKKAYPFPGAANVSVPVLIVAALQFNARAYPAIVDGPTIVKSKVNGNDEGLPVIGMDGQPVMQMDEDGQPEPMWQIKPGAKRERGERISRHMSYQLLEEMPGWEESVDKELIQVPIVGCVFRKTYREAVKRRNESKLIPAIDLVVNDETTEDLDDCPCITEVCRYYRHQIETKFRKKEWRDIEIEWDENEPHKKEVFLEQHCHMDLDGDGYTEPYIITVHKETQKPVRIVTCFEPEDIDADDSGNIIAITKTQYYTKIAFLPHPKGRFYDLGFGLLLRYLNKSINTTLNMLLDAGKLANMRGGFIGRGPDIRAEQTRIGAGEWKFVNTPGGALRDSIVPLDYKEPSPVLFQLMQFLIEFANKITSVQDVLTGDVNPNIKPTTIIAQVEQATKQLRTIFKRILRGHKAEFQKLRRLNKMHMSDKEYFTLHDDPEAVAREDYEDEDLDISPAADPRMVFDMQRMAQAEAIFGWGQQSPFADQEATNRQFVLAIGGDPETLMQEPQGNPALELQMAELELKGRAQQVKELETALKREKQEAEILKIFADAELSASKAEAESVGIDLEDIRQYRDGIQQLHQMSMDRINAITTAMGQGQSANQPTGSGAVEGQSGNGVDTELLQRLRGELQGGMDGMPAPQGGGPGGIPAGPGY